MSIIDTIKRYKQMDKDQILLMQLKIKRVWNMLFYTSKQFVIFAILIILYLINTIIITKLLRKLPIPNAIASSIQIKFSQFYLDVSKRLEGNLAFSISKLDLIHIALRNMQVKKTRSYITIGGVALGIGAIVFLVSIGYGLKGLVLGRVAKLEELRQADVSVQPGSRIRITDKSLSDAKALPEVADAYPVIAVVGRVNYQNSVSDMAVYGVTTGYLKNSSINTIQGKLFDSDSISLTSLNTTAGAVAGASTISSTHKLGEKIGDISFSIAPDNWVRVRKDPSTNSEILGYTKRSFGNQQGELVWGSSYGSDTGSGEAGTNADGEKLGRWVKSNYQLWEKNRCDESEPDCTEGKYVMQRDSTGDAVYNDGYAAEINISVLEEKSVLGISDINDDALLAQALEVGETVAETTSPTGIVAIPDSSDPNSNWVIVPDETQTENEKTVQQVSLSTKAIKQAVVNKAMLRLINLNESEAVGKKFSVSFIIPSNLLENSKDRVESTVAEYEIVGVTIDDNTPIFYVPFVDLRSLGIVNYSQFKVIAKNESALPKVREQIGSMGYLSQSVQDTVSQINSLFNTIVLVLGSMGMIALAIASLGMFNTLTVSLLERSREVGLMKAMGMKTDEVKQLFLIESMIMGFASGFFGLLLGWVAGKLLSLVLTIVALTKGQGIINVSHIPFAFVMLILFLSLLVGLFTGIFPAQRSKKISALNALRYE